MSLLHQKSSEEQDEAARGESFTRGTSHIVWASIAAVAFVSVAIAVYFVAGEKPPAVTGEILEVWAHPMHTTTPAFDAAGAAIPQDNVDQILVFTRVRLHNQSSQPLYLLHIMANVKLDDGLHTSYAAVGSQYDRVFVAYPELTPYRSAALSSDLALAPGQTQEGTFVASFRMTPQQWQARKGLDYGFGFRYQPLLTLTPKAPVTER